MARSIVLPLLIASALGCNAFDEPNEQSGGGFSQPGSAPAGAVGGIAGPTFTAGTASLMPPPSAGFAGTGGFAGSAGTAGSSTVGPFDGGLMDDSDAGLEDGGPADAAH